MVFRGSKSEKTDSRKSVKRLLAHVPAGKRWLPLILVLALILCSAVFKIVKIERNPYFRPSGPGILYYSEAAFHYRYAAIFAEHQSPLNAVQHDRFVQFPEAVNAFQYYTILMEMAAGCIYRFSQPDMPFHLFLIRFQCLFSSLPILVVFLISRRLYHNNGLAVMASLLYATTPASYERTISVVYLREDFTLTFLLLSFYLFIIVSDRNKSVLLSLLLGLVMVVALSSWHFSQFFYLCSLPYLFFMFCRRPEQMKNLFLPLVILFIAGFTVPVLRDRGFIAGFLMCGYGAILVGHLLARKQRRPLTRGCLALSVMAGMILITRLTGLHNSSYDHVYALFFEKIRFFLQKPVDPGMLSFEARQLWEGDFLSPSLAEIWSFGKLVLPAGLLLAFRRLWTDLKENRPVSLVKYYAVVLFGLMIMVTRIRVLLIPFCAVLCCEPVRKKRVRSWHVMALMAVAAGLNLSTVHLKPMWLDNYDPVSYEQVFNWLRRNTGPEDAFLAKISVSPIILLNTGRPQILHSKFENRPMRQRNEEFLTALYAEGEQRLFDFCRKYGAGHFVFQNDLFIHDGKNSNRYKAGIGFRISRHSLAARLFFCDPLLIHFIPVYQNLYFTIFKVVETADSFSSQVRVRPPPQFSQVCFSEDNGAFVNTEATYNTLMDLVNRNLSRGVELFRAGKYREARAVLEPVTQVLRHENMSAYYLAAAYAGLGQTEAARQILNAFLKYKDSKDLVVAEYDARIMVLDAELKYASGDMDGALNRLTASLPNPFHPVGVYLALADIHERKQNWAQAAEYLRLFLEKADPLPPEVSSELSARLSGLEQIVKREAGEPGSPVEY